MRVGKGRRSKVELEMEGEVRKERREDEERKERREDEESEKRGRREKEEVGHIYFLCQKID